MGTQNKRSNIDYSWLPEGTIPSECYTDHLPSSLLFCFAHYSVLQRRVLGTRVLVTVPLLVTDRGNQTAATHHPTWTDPGAVVAFRISSYCYCYHCIALAIPCTQLFGSFLHIKYLFSYNNGTPISHLYVCILFQPWSCKHSSIVFIKIHWMGSYALLVFKHLFAVAHFWGACVDVSCVQDYLRAGRKCSHA